MVHTIRPTVNGPRLGEPSGGPLQRVEGLAGVSVLTIVVTTLGLALSGGHLATDMLLVILGYRMTTSLRQGQYEDRTIVRFWLSHLGRVGVPLLVALGLTVSYWRLIGAITEPQLEAVAGAMTMTLNIVEGSGAAHFAAVSHLKLVALVTQFAFVLPVLLFVCRKLRSGRRAALLWTVGLAMTVARVWVLVEGRTPHDTGILAAMTRADGLVIGAAIAVAPLPLLRRVMPSTLVAPLFSGLLLAFVVAAGNPTSVGVTAGLSTFTTVILSTAVVTTAVGGGLTGPLAAVVDSQTMRWLGARAISLYIWHQLIGYLLLAETDEGASLSITSATEEWPGILAFGLRVVFTLAAAATSHRFLELPIAGLARQLTTQVQRGPVDSAADQPGHTGRSSQRASLHPVFATAGLDVRVPIAVTINQPEDGSSGNEPDLQSPELTTRP